MTGKDILNAVGNIDDEFIEAPESVGATGKVKRRRTAIIAACIAALLIAGAAAAALNMRGGTPDAPQPAVVSDSAAGENTDALYIPAIELPESTDGAAMDMIGLVVYKGGIYTQAEWYNDEQAEKLRQTLVGEKLGHAKGTIDEWSTQDDYATEFASTYDADIFAVNGYGDDFRVCMSYVWEDENGASHASVEFMERLNGIYLDAGADLFRDRLRLPGRVVSVDYQRHEDWDYAVNEFHTVSVTAESMDAFIDALCAGKFVNTWETMNDIYERDDISQKHLLLHMEDGTTVSLRLFGNGYIGYGPLGWYFVDMPGEAFDAVWELCE